MLANAIRTNNNHNICISTIFIHFGRNAIFEVYLHPIRHTVVRPGSTNSSNNFTTLGLFNIKAELLCRLIVSRITISIMHKTLSRATTIYEAHDEISTSVEEKNVTQGTIYETKRTTNVFQLLVI